MITVSECFDKVKTDCFKFIKSQETSKEKFKRKEKMLKSFLIPACFWISSKTKSKNPFFLGLVGGQGTGKTTTSSILEIILVNNGSNDNTEMLFKTLLNESKLFRTVHVNKNQGYGYGILQGLSKANGEYIGWMHADLQTDPKDIIKVLDLIL